MRFVAAILTLLVFYPAVSAETEVRRIALTFDDATRGDGPVFTGEQRTTALIESMDRSGVDGAMFFVTTRNVQRQGESGAARLAARPVA